jgi:hypothetical protein
MHTIKLASLSLVTTGHAAVNEYDNEECVSADNAWYEAYQG